MPQRRDDGTSAVMRWDGGLCSDGEHLCDWCELDKYDNYVCTKYVYQQLEKDANGVPVRLAICARDTP